MRTRTHACIHAYACVHAQALEQQNGEAAKMLVQFEASLRPSDAILDRALTRVRRPLLRPSPLCRSA